MILWLRFPNIPGGDISREVVEVGPGVTRFKPGDAVVAFVDLRRGGGCAELAVVKESAAALLPGSLSFVEVGSMPIAGVTALQALRDVGGLKASGSARGSTVPRAAVWATSLSRSSQRSVRR